MTTFRKKPVLVEAFQITRATRADNRDWPEWLNLAWNTSWPSIGAVSCEDYPQSNGDDRLVVMTLNGSVRLDWDDWIVRGVAGELYPCRADIFSATYERDRSADDILTAPELEDGVRVRFQGLGAVPWKRIAVALMRRLADAGLLPIVHVRELDQDAPAVDGIRDCTAAVPIHYRLTLVPGRAETPRADRVDAEGVARG